MKFRAFFLITFIMVLTGCIGNRAKPVAEPSPVLKNWTSDEVLDVIGQRAQAVRQVKSLITVKIDGKKSAGFFLPIHNLDAALWTERPHQIRLQGFNPLGGTLFDLVSKDGRLQLSVPGRSKEVQERLQDMLIRNGERASFSSEVLDALAGGGQPLMRPSEFSAVEQVEGEIILYQFVLETEGRSRLIRKYWLDNNRLLAKQAVYFAPSGRPSVTLRYQDYLTVPSSGEEIESPDGAIVSPGGTPPGGAIEPPGGAIVPSDGARTFWPREVTAILTDKGQLMITFREVKLNQPFQAGAFSPGAMPR